MSKHTSMTNTEFNIKLGGIYMRVTNSMMGVSDKRRITLEKRLGKLLRLLRA